MLLACDVATDGGIIVGRRARRARAVAVACVAVACAVVACRPAAAAGWNNFNSVRPRCGQAGTTVEVTISGSWLVDPQEFEVLGQVHDFGAGMVYDDAQFERGLRLMLAGIVSAAREPTPPLLT